MDFRTELIVPKARWTLGIGESVLTLGSCFALSMGQRFIDNKFKTLVNPFGTTYHPISIHRLLDYSSRKEYPAPSTYLTQEERALNFDFHSSMSAGDIGSLQRMIHERIDHVCNHLKHCRALVLTYGTAWIYERVDSGEAVANCHRLPGSGFTKRLASVDEIKASFQKTFQDLLAINPQLRVILTVSPVRHLKDTLHLNSVSKASLLLACYQLAQISDAIDYFPAYEILLDDLRDYRFYKDDLIHPSTTAEEYIWEKFITTYFDKTTTSFIDQWRSVRQAMDHRAFHPDSDGHQQFLRRVLGQLEDLRSTVDVEQEIRQVKSQLLSR